MDKRYSVVTFIFGDYEILREPTIPDPDAEYICITDRKDLKSENWKIIVDDQGIKEDNYEGNNTALRRVFKAKYHWMDYCSTNNCFRVDGSIQIYGSLKSLITQIEGDILFCVHPNRQNGIDEYDIWIKQRGLSPIYKEKYIKETTDDIENNMQLIECTYMFSRKNEKTIKFWKDFYKFYIESEKFDDRLDQIWLSYFLYTYNDPPKITWYTRQMYISGYMKLFKHNTWANINTQGCIQQVQPRVQITKFI